MADPSGGIGSLLGVKYASLIAGLAGAVVSLSYLKELTKWQMVLAVLTGALVAGYMTPIVNWYFDLEEVLSNGMAFILGLTSMNIVPGVMKLSEIVRNDPMSLINRGKK
jgi:hypothetical protein